MTAPDIDQRAFDAAYAKLTEALTDGLNTNHVARAVCDALAGAERVHGHSAVRRIAERPDVRHGWILGTSIRRRVQCPVVAIDAAVAAAARVLAEG